jgi:hypothetical protein
LSLSEKVKIIIDYPKKQTEYVQTLKDEYTENVNAANQHNKINDVKVKEQLETMSNNVSNKQTEIDSSKSKSIIANIGEQTEIYLISTGELVSNKLPVYVKDDSSLEKVNINSKNIETIKKAIETSNTYKQNDNTSVVILNPPSTTTPILN